MILGRISALFRYPVKSMAAEQMQSADVGWQGISGDRRWAFVRGGMEQSGFPWLTIREQPLMAQYVPRFTDADLPDSSRTMVSSPAGIDYDVTDPGLAKELGFDSHVIRQSRGIFDAFPLSAISTGTIDSIAGTVGDHLDQRRFRPNVVIEFAAGEPFAEDALVGREIRFGSVSVRFDKRDKRCVAINVDPVTSTRNPAVLRAVAQERQACLGVYASIVHPGFMSVDDPVVLVRS